MGTEMKMVKRYSNFVNSRRLTVSNTLYKKKDEKRITYKRGGTKTQIDYILVMRNGGVKVIDNKVIPGEACLTQHRLVCSDLRRKE